MPGKNDAYGFPPDSIDHAAFAGFFGQQANRPPRPSLRRRSTYQRDQGCLLRAVEHRAWFGPGLVG